MSEQQNSAEGEPSAARSWIVREVHGRGSSSEKGLAPVHAMVLQRPDGREFSIRRVGAGEGEVITMSVLRVAKPMTFDRCPICLEPDPTSKEHVPPAALGGSVMTSTCQPCNNKLGSILESTLVDWWDDAVGSVSFSHDNVPGRRKTARVLLRETDSGEPVYLLTGDLDHAIRSKMEPGDHVEMTCTMPDRRRYQLAALKSAYLGACLILGSIPETPEAAAVRAELTAVRDLPRRQRPQISELCDNLTVRGSHGPVAPGEVALVQIHTSAGREPEVAISLARALLVTWPIGGFLVGFDSDENLVNSLKL